MKRSFAAAAILVAGLVVGACAPPPGPAQFQLSSTTVARGGYVLVSQVTLCPPPGPYGEGFNPRLVNLTNNYPEWASLSEVRPDGSADPVKLYAPADLAPGTYRVEVVCTQKWGPSGPTGAQGLVYEPQEITVT